MRYSLAVAVAIATASWGRTEARSQTTCHSTDTVSAQMLADFTHVATGTDTLSWFSRVTMGIPQVAANQVSYITNNTICSNASGVYDSITASSPSVSPSGTLYIIQVGSVYVVWDPAKKMGDYRQIVVLSSAYGYISANMW